MTLARSDRTNMPLKTFKIGEKLTIAWIFISNQDLITLCSKTTLSRCIISEIHLLLIIPNWQQYHPKNKIKCLDGTIPVLLNTKNFITDANFFAEKYIHPQSADSPGVYVEHFHFHSIIS
ncbi:hypothetical protein HID58_049633 [Brassica napus]|uniref:Uncharacterized protein n=1 Tax=Brassica napus TaxID=3708 RepID=A0ABQ8B5J1_BRANA|nr:hypothetical protein HID58_049633 [Brassica napus]